MFKFPELKTIVVTGGAGFIGSNLALSLQFAYPKAEILVIDDFSSGTYKNLRGFKGDIITTKLGPPKAFDDLHHFLKQKIDVVFHQAAITDTTIHDEERVMISNLESLRQMINFSRLTQAKLIYASSSAVYGQHSEEPMTIGQKENPLNVYAFSKLAADNLAKKFMNKTKIVGLRYFNVYGQGESNKNKAASMIYQIYMQLTGRGDVNIRYTKPQRTPHVKLFKGSDNYERDWVYVEDVVNANLFALNAESGIYNIGSGRSVSFKKIIEIVKRELGIKGQIHLNYFNNPAPQYYQKFTCANLKTTKEKMVDYEPTSISKGIKSYIRYLEEERCEEEKLITL